jgi:hypothetical protein
LVPEAGSAPAPAVWKTAMHLSTPLGRNWHGPPPPSGYGAAAFAYEWLAEP